MKKVAIVLTNGFEDMEFIAPLDLMRRAGLAVTSISLDQHLAVQSHHQVTMQADALLADVDLTQFDALVFPGGYVDLNQYRALAESIQIFANDPNKTLAAICAAPTVLAELGYLTDKSATCYPAMQQVLLDNGAKYQDQHIVVEDNLILGQAPAAAIAFGLALVERLAGAKVAQETAKGIVA